MKKKLKGGIETVVAIVIITGLVVGLIAATVIPIGTEAEKLTGSARGSLSTLSEALKP